jgi:hypothetical protein
MPFDFAIFSFAGNVISDGPGLSLELLHLSFYPFAMGMSGRKKVPPSQAWFVHHDDIETLGKRVSARRQACISASWTDRIEGHASVPGEPVKTISKRRL